MPATKKQAEKTERVTLSSELAAVVNGKGCSAEDAAKKITARGRFEKRNKGTLTPGEVLRCARWHDDLFSVKDDTIKARAPKARS